ncbi:MAG: hypothetical protein J7639_11745 [Paenibacillaceae bacterium]|uniref:hypothetical protein n=1 Tax=Paenibacillus cymbidii TaxID=1639034 RepID=UPI0010822470|nr:hypothetical protein [Paenibacillus cymbidii]MBO9606620.1 hypothetical protein [Paenibacillaceae bacterium]
MSEQDIVTLAALVAAFVGVAKGFGLPSKYCPVAAIGIAAVFVLVPPPFQAKLITISMIGLTASGTYQFAKRRKEDAG